MTEAHDDAPLGLADIAPVDLPEGLFEDMIAVAVDPDTPPVDDSVLPDDDPSGDTGDTGGDDGPVDLGDLDDDAGADGDPDPGDDGSAGHDLPGRDLPADDPDDPLAGEAEGGATTDPAVDPAAYHDPLAGDPAEDPAAHADPGVDGGLDGDTDDLHTDLPDHDDTGM